MKKVLLKSFTTPEVAESIIELLKSHGIEAQLPGPQTDASLYFGRSFNHTDVCVPQEQLEEAKQILKELEESND